MQRVERQAFDAHHLLVTHRRRFSQRVQLRGEFGRRHPFCQRRRVAQLGHAHDVDVDRIPKQATHRAIRTDVVAAVEERVKRIHADEIRADAASPLGERRVVRQIAHAPVRVTANRVEIRDQPEGGGVAEDVVRRPASIRNDDECLLITPIAGIGCQLDTNAMVADRQLGREVEGQQRRFRIPAACLVSPPAFGDECEPPRAAAGCDSRHANCRAEAVLDDWRATRTGETISLCSSRRMLSSASRSAALEETSNPSADRIARRESSLARWTRPSMSKYSGTIPMRAASS
jgi:hypothetical protein